MSLSVECQEHTLVDVVARHYIQSAEPVYTHKVREGKRGTDSGHSDVLPDCSVLRQDMAIIVRSTHIQYTHM
jgi:hypothetical protein